MDVLELNELLDNSITYSGEFTTYDYDILSKKIDILLDMDREKSIYYYSIKYDDLLSSKLNRSDLSDLFMKGWEYDSDIKCLIRKI